MIRGLNVYFAMLPAGRIFGSVGRSGGGYNTIWSDWSDEGRRRRELIMREYEQAMDALCGHYSRLEKSVLEEGIRNPIIVTRGPPRRRTWEHIPPEWRSLPPQDLYIMETTVGGSRLWVAQKHNMMIPCLINDWVHTDHTGVLVRNVEQARQYYRDPPSSLSVNIKWGLVESFDKHKVGHHLGEEWREDILVQHRAPIWVGIMNKHGYRVDRLPDFVHDILLAAGIDQSKVGR